MTKTNNSSKILTSLALLGMLAAIPAVASAQTVSNLRGGIDMVTSSTNDAQLEKNVERALVYNMGTDIWGLDVDAYNGMVTIKGGVDLPVQIERATSILHGMGVSDVANNLSVKSEMPEYQRWIEDAAGA